MYRPIDAAVLRGTALLPARDPLWPEVDTPVPDVQALRDWLAQAWTPTFAAAVTMASTDLSATVHAILDGRQQDPTRVARAAAATLKYLLRAHSRATPFGLFAGVTPVRIRTTAGLRLGTAHRATTVLDFSTLAAAAEAVEADEDARQQLTLVTSSLVVERDGHAVLDHRRSPTPGHGPDQVRIRITGPVREAMTGARTPVRWSDLAAQLTERHREVPAAAVEALLANLVRHSVLLTSARAPMATTDPLAAVPRPAAQPVPGHEVLTQGAERASVCLRLDWDVDLPAEVAEEAAAAAAVLTRLAPQPALRGWPGWHTRFLERYGPGALVPATEAVDVLGYPAGYRGTPDEVASEPLAQRDRRLVTLAQRALRQGVDEVELTDADLAALATTGQDQPVQPSTELTVRIHAPSPEALQQGRFTLNVVGVARSAGTTVGRFLHTFDPADRERIAAAYAKLPGVHRDALLAQISAPPLTGHAENVARAPQVTDLQIPVGDHPAPGTAVLPLGDLLVTADAQQLHLYSRTHQRPVHTLLLNAVDLVHHSHPLTRFLAEAPAALAAPCTGFAWGTAATHLPFLPALRYRRTVISPARWRLDADDLPSAGDQALWDHQLGFWANRMRLPTRVYLADADQALALDLAQPSHRTLLRRHLLRFGTATLHRAPDAEDLGWIQGRAHEAVIALAAHQDHAPVAVSGHVAKRSEARLPGCGDLLDLHLHGHRGEQDAIVLRHLPALLAAVAPTACWFLRYREPADHLRLRICVADGALGAAFTAVGTWTRALQQAGLITHTTVHTHQPETGRFGGPAALAAVEHVFAADSAAARAQLAATSTRGGPDPRALTAASMLNLATGLLGERTAALRWLTTRTRTTDTPPPRAVHQQALALAGDPSPDPGMDVLTAWAARAEALAAYRQALTGAELGPEDTLADLLHLHHARVHGPDLGAERIHLHLARAAALSWSARARRSS
ncbi:thiopeptide-type bacteriocin biosynthesis protein [Streptacidiphilus sp. MAP12-33]|uniref:lantibiotic dehydratase n=1 Tax=Streptacidiphilus sp. MAP12-33 TaxID=3156266 RepID=UPI00351381F1